MGRAGKRIEEIRRLVDMSQEDFADALHVSRKTVGRWEREETEPKYRDVEAAEKLLKRKSGAAQ
jgi:DNA-binding transcriptional regulator YiaG